MDDKKVREFNTGATRDTDTGKNDYEGYFSPLVFQEFGNYMTKHRIQPDGKLRDSDNWQKGFGENHSAVCMKSLWRHFLDFWAIHRGYKRYDSKDNHEITILEAGSAILFNIMAYLHKILEKTNKD